MKHLKYISLVWLAVLLSACNWWDDDDDPVIQSATTDIGITAINASSDSLSAGQQFSADVTVKNNGTTNLSNISFKIYLSDDNAFSVDDAELGTGQLAALNSASTETVKIQGVMPARTAGDYFIIAKITANGDTVPANDTIIAGVKVITVNATSGGVGVLSTGSSTIAFLPTGTGLVPLVVQQNTASASRGSLLARTASARVSANFTIDSCSVDGSAQKIVCVGYRSDKVAIFDISTYLTSLDENDISVEECSSGSGAGSVSFSGGSCKNCGVATDPGDSRYVVASFDGIRTFDYTSTSGQCDLIDHYDIPINENIGFDASRNWVITPEYDGFGSYTKQDGTIVRNEATMRIVNIETDDIYEWDKKILCSDLVEAGESCSWRETDAASIDLGTGMIALQEESVRATVLIDMSQASFDSTTKTFTAPHEYVPLENISARTPGGAIEPSSHILFMEQEFGRGIAVLQLPDVGGSGSTFPTPTAGWEYNSANVPSNTVCNRSSWSNAGDPHGLAIFTGVVAGKAFGLLINGTKDCVALVDLKGLLDAPKATGSNIADSSDVNFAGLFQFIKTPATTATETTVSR